jgi:hypothetical protein
MTRAEMAEALRALVGAGPWAEKAAESLRLEAERLAGLGFESGRRDADTLSVHLTRMREGRESAARVLGMVEDA